ncbi:conserved hypothetical protein [[Clostridium] ultunense Esp]|nr:conserved hypothetical protein [[Clostridium] ultunense Esp]
MASEREYRIVIEFCVWCDYSPEALSLSQSLLNYFGTEIKELLLIPTKGGKFEVTVNGRLLHSKLDTGEFPDTDRLLRTMNEMETL